MEYFELFSQFTAMIRLPDTMMKSEKIDRMNEVIDELDLRHCVNTGEAQILSLLTQVMVTYVTLLKQVMVTYVTHSSR